ncbi:unnamed protein product [Acanthoscelides obtectus]|uniref:Uncharacterized protein n=1 Tax=Acanthoscelides obtectus TaxID=200917 RepID=A0A9P0JL33_ACAOB|nr:unnamed protein product [Acanthoscelides obtectus]CAK1655009.1 hypothetical protein AOBTE_LOCUS18959 [Acanthoscelides obtectus]
MWQFQVCFFTLFFGAAFSQCVYPNPASNLFLKKLLLNGKNWYAQQRFGVPTGFITEKCWKTSFHLSDIHLDTTVHPSTVYFDERNNKQETKIVANIIGLKNKYYIPYNNTDYMLTDIKITHNYVVSQVCDMSKGRYNYYL